jgi:D-glycero-alpha-D-manno-heptose-7-phosphate kinase
MGIRSKAPFRIDFAGGGTDVAPYCDEFKGAVLNATINYFAYVTITGAEEKGIHVNSLDFDEYAHFYTEDDLDNEGPLGLVKATLREIQRKNDIDIMDSDHGINVFIHSDAPPGSGLGSSSTVCVTLLGALLDYYKIPLTNYEIGELSFDIERVKLGIKGGSQDQFAATFGGFNFMEFYQGKTIVNPLRIRHETINELQYSLVMVYTGKSRMSDGILDEQIRLYNEHREDVIEYYHRAVELANELKNALLKEDLLDFARLLSQAYENKNHFCDRIKSDRIAQVYDMAMENGAIGGRIMGAGAGGFMLFYVDYEKKRHFLKTMKDIEAEPLNFAFEERGMQTWRIRNGENPC